MPPVIRPARASDHKALVEQYLGLNLHEDPITHDRVTDRAGAEESLAAAEAWVAKTNGAVLVAEVDGRVVGHLFLTFEQSPPFVRKEARAYAYIAELFVRAEARRIGVARALIEEAERIARQRGVARIMVSALVGNDSAEGLYERIGFLPYAIELIKEFNRET
jgi:GNAT superfamily N-acetyltransferase